MAQPPCITGKMYHVYNRGVDGRIVFSDAYDHSYFMHLLYLFNDTRNACNTHRIIKQAHDEEQTFRTERTGERLVTIHTFALMPNHYHLLLTQNIDGGAALFMQRVGTGYTLYFNARHERSGSLFQGTYKRVLVDEHAYLLWLPHYIHMNPLPLRTENSNSTSALDYLLRYPWTGLPNYLGATRYGSVINTKLILDLFGGSHRYHDDLMPYVTLGKPLDIADPTLLIDETI